MGLLDTYGLPILGMQPPPIPPEWQISQADLNAMQAQAAQNAQNAQNAQYNYLANAQNTTKPLPSSLADQCNRARELFMGRMAGVRDEFNLKINDFIHCQVHDDTVFVFFLLDGKEGVVKEQVDIFPSDQLIAQFRVVIS